MARPASETIDKARAAFIELVRRKERPTVAKIRALIGGGGTELIQRVMSEMQDELYRKMFDVAGRPDVPPVVIDTAMRLWDETVRLAAALHDAERQEAARQIVEANGARDDALTRADELARRLDTLEEQLSAKTGEASALRTSLETAERHGRDLERSVSEKTEEAERARRSAEERIHEAEERTAEQQRLAEERYRGLEARLLENADRERTQAAREITRLKTEVADAVAARDKAVAEASRAGETILVLKDQIANLKSEVSETKGRLAVMIEERERAEKRAAKSIRKLGARSRQTARAGRGRG